MQSSDIIIGKEEIRKIGSVKIVKFKMMLKTVYSTRFEIKSHKK